MCFHSSLADIRCYMFHTNTDDHKDVIDFTAHMIMQISFQYN